MDYYLLGERLSNYLGGKTCFTSRKHEPNIKGHFATLHSLVYKVIRKSDTFRNSVKEKLAGGLMLENIRQALESVLGYTPSDQQVFNYYYNLRKHQNYGKNINLLKHGNELLEEYQLIKKDTMDWEESMQLATWYLKDNIVNSIENFNFDNLILLRPWLLNLKKNKNASEFFSSLCAWSERHTDLNIFYITNSREIFYYQNGEFKKQNIYLKDGCQLQSSFLI